MLLHGCFFKLSTPFLRADAVGYVPLPLGNSHRLSKEMDWFCLHLLVDIYLQHINKMMQLPNSFLYPFFHPESYSFLGPVTNRCRRRNAHLRFPAISISQVLPKQTLSHTEGSSRGSSGLELVNFCTGFSLLYWHCSSTDYSNNCAVVAWNTWAVGFPSGFYKEKQDGLLFSVVDCVA